MNKNQSNTIFKLLSVALPFIAILFIEILLRVFHYGYNTNLFIDDKNGYVHNNNEISKLFFNDDDIAPEMYVQHFLKVKPANTSRVFVLGESSALGFPYNHRGSFPRMLQYMVNTTCNNRKVEVINLAITAINSYALLYFTDEIIRMSPDAILIYTGHNEYYGALGVGSQQKGFVNRNFIKLIINLKRIKLVQFFFQFYSNCRDIFRSNNVKQESGLMPKMARDKEIRYGDKLYQDGLMQFKNNLSELIIKYQKQHIPIYLSNVVCNEKGQKPFISKLAKNTDTTQFMKFFTKAQRAYVTNNYDTALVYSLIANSLDSTYAMNNFILGDIYNYTTEFKVAKKYYKKAKEFDCLRFRAPEAINQIIFDECEKHDNVYFVNSLSLFTEKSHNGICGNDLFIDHLHPNLSGNFVIAQAFFFKLKKTNFFECQQNDISMTTLRKELPVIIIDSIKGELLARFMKKKWPFFEPSEEVYNYTEFPEILSLSYFQKKISWDEAADSLFKFYVKENNFFDALKVANAYHLEHPTELFIIKEMAKLYVKIGKLENAVKCYKQALGVSYDTESVEKIVSYSMELDKPDDALFYLKILLQNQPNDKKIIFLQNQLNEVIYIKKLETKGDISKRVIFGLANYYMYIKHLNSSKKYIDIAKANYPNDKKVFDLLTSYKLLLSGSHFNK